MAPCAAALGPPALYCWAASCAPWACLGPAASCLRYTASTALAGPEQPASLASCVVSSLCIAVSSACFCWDCSRCAICCAWSAADCAAADGRICRFREETRWASAASQGAADQRRTQVCVQHRSPVVPPTRATAEFVCMFSDKAVRNFLTHHRATGQGTVSFPR